MLRSTNMKKTKRNYSKKHVLPIALALALLISGGIFFKEVHDRNEDKMGVLVLQEQGIRVKAPRNDIEKYTEAYANGEDSAVLDEILENILSDPKNVVEKFSDSDADPGTSTEDEDVVDVEAVQAEP